MNNILPLIVKLPFLLIFLLIPKFVSAKPIYVHRANDGSIVFSNEKPEGPFQTFTPKTSPLKEKTNTSPPQNSLKAEQLIYVKYRSTPVDISREDFEKLPRSDSSLVKAAWYDSKNQYLIINLIGTNYHYCGLDQNTWNNFKNAASLGKTYHSSIRGNFDCRVFPVPKYESRKKELQSSKNKIVTKEQSYSGHSSKNRRNYLRTGEEVEYYDYENSEYRYGTIESLSNTEAEISDTETGEYKFIDRGDLE